MVPKGLNGTTAEMGYNHIINRRNSIESVNRTPPWIPQETSKIGRQKKDVVKQQFWEQQTEK